MDCINAIIDCNDECKTSPAPVSPRCPPPAPAPPPSPAPPTLLLCIVNNRIWAVGPSEWAGPTAPPRSPKTPCVTRPEIPTVATRSAPCGLGAVDTQRCLGAPHWIDVCQTPRPPKALFLPYPPHHAAGGLPSCCPPPTMTLVACRAVAPPPP